jgi:hypothetical protein
VTNGTFLWLLRMIFAALALDALRTPGPRSPGFQSEEADPNSDDLMRRPVIKRSGRSVAVVFAALSSICGFGAWASD